jgi:hypothetical protein
MCLINAYVKAKHSDQVRYIFRYSGSNPDVGNMGCESAGVLTCIKPKRTQEGRIITATLHQKCI